MSPRLASLQVAHQRGCASETKTSLASLEGCTCKPSYFTFRRDERGRKIKGKRVRDRRVAERELRKLQVELDEGRVEVKRRSTLTLPDWVDQYLDEIVAYRVRGRTMAASTGRHYEETLRLAAKEIGHVELSRMDESDIRRFVRSLNVSTATKLRRLRELRACLNAAGRKHLEHNPVSDYLRTAEGKALTRSAPRRGKDAFTDAELEQLWQALKQTADEVYLYLFKAAVETGARISELCGLDWDDVDLLIGKVTISKQYVPVDGMTAPKDHEKRTVYLTPDGKGLFLEWAQIAGTSGPVFTGRAGNRINSDYTWRVLEYAREHAGIPKAGESDLPRTVHSLRDTYARRMLESGRHPQWVQDNLGHAGLDLTINVYGKWSEEARLAEAAGA